MTDPPTILAFSGSLREGSYNQRLVRIAAGGAEAAGADVTLLDLRDLPLPVYSADLEKREGLPPNAVRANGCACAPSTWACSERRSHLGKVTGSIHTLS